MDVHNDISLPEVLYHGSPIADLEEIEPRQISFRDKDEGARVFATPDKRLATIFAVKNGKVVETGHFNETLYAVILGSVEDFIADDKGSYIYALHSHGFECDPEKGLGNNEWTCKVSVRPQNREYFPSALDAMLQAGCQVYFVDAATHEAIKKSDDQGYAILKSLQSENQRRNLNVIEF